MQFIDPGPDIPDDLIRAQLAGEVVFVVGAGVSRRVGLPLFADLVAQVYERVGQACPGAPGSLADVAEADAWGKGEWDRTLGLLEHRLVYTNPNRLQAENIVREAVTAILKPTRRVATPHRHILQIQGFQGYFHLLETKRRIQARKVNS